MSGEKESRVAIVTGSTKGIGRSIAETLATKGIRTVVTSRDKQRAREAVREIEETGAECLSVEFDIESTGECSRVVDETLKAFGRVDILVNNALSQSSVMPLETLTDDQIQSAFCSNIANTFLLCRSAYPYLEKTRGSIVNIGSVVTNRHLLGLPIYGIVKAAVLQMTKVLAAEWAAAGVRVNAINPGFVRTSAFSELGMPDELVEKSYEYYRTYHPIGRVGKPEEVAMLAAYLVSENASLITGTVVDIDGGYSVSGLPLYDGTGA